MNKNTLKLLGVAALLLTGTAMITMGLTGNSSSSSTGYSNNVKMEDSSLYSANMPLVLSSSQNATIAPPKSSKVVKGINVNSSRVISIATEIDYVSMMKATSKLQQLDQTDGDIYVLLSSPGGSVLDGEAFISAMESARNKVHTICADLCASMAAIIHQHGVKRYAYDRSILMFHDASGGAQGEVGKMMSMLSFISRKLEKTNRYIAQRSGIKYETFEKLVLRDLWIDAEDSKQLGLVDDIIKVIPNVELSIDDSFFGRKQKSNNPDTNNNKVITVVPMTIGVTNK